MKGTTKSGFVYNIKKETFDDIEILEAVCGIERGDLQQIPFLISKILGEEQKQKYYEHLKRKFGRAKVSIIDEELTAIMENHEETKNS